VSVNEQTVLNVLATAALSIDVKLASGGMLGQRKKLTGVKMANETLIADDVTFFNLRARVSGVVIYANGEELAMTTDILDDARSPVGGDLLVPLSAGFMGK
jgi:hypothetical protein